MTITIDLPVRPYVKKFIQARYGITAVWQINRLDRFGKLFYCLLERAPRRYSKPEPFPKDMSCILQVRVISKYVHQRGHYLSYENSIEFNECVKLHLIEEIADYERKLKENIGIKKYPELYLKHQTTKLGPRKTIVAREVQLWQHFEFREIVNDVLKRYGITEDDFAFDTVKKNVQRLKTPLRIAV